jgi:NADP-dependent 3-hydroxy acid dehydrogenase YdfG/acyl carrier protein
VLAIVAEQTGYPVELLAMDLDLEADLGIDTVKQAEVFAAIRETYGIERDDSLQLRDYPTLNHVVGFVNERTPQAAAPAPAEPAPAAETAPVTEADEFPRRIPVPVVRPPLDRCAPTGVELGAGSRVVLFADAGGVGAALASRLEKLGVDVLGIEGSPAADTLEAQLAEWHAAGPVHGVYWLPALDAEAAPSGTGPAIWREELRIRVKLLAVTMRALAGDVGAGGTFLVSATRLGGRHGYDAAGATSVLGGAVSGFTKALARERPDALVKNVDFTASRKTKALADLLIAETLNDPGAVEIGYADGLRWTVGLIEVPAVPDPARAPTKDSVFLVTGAAGSIVSAITADLATAAGGGTFHLLDLVPEPDPDDPDLARFVQDRDALKRDIAGRIQAGGTRPTPKLVERELARIERARAALDAIEAIQKAGGTADWHQVDLTDSGAVGATVASVLGGSGRVDVLLHAAGLDVSHFLPDKPQREYDLVFDVKAEGWLNLLNALGDAGIDGLGAAIVFSSIAARFGNAGQTDYAAANDLLCKSMSNLRGRGVHAIALDWTAWADIGMASRGSIPKVMEAAGIAMLPPEVGVPVVRRELTAAGPGGEVVVAGRLGVLLEERHATGGIEPFELDGPISGRAERLSVADGVVVETTLDPPAQGFLNDHRIDGTPVLPGVMGVEAFAETAKALVPGWQVAAVENVDLIVPFKFYRDEPRTIETRALVRDGGDGTVVADCGLIGRRTLPGQGETETVHFTGRVRLAPDAPEAPRAAAPERAHGTEVGSEDLYRVYFHGPAYRVLAKAYRADGDVVGELAEGLPPNHDHGETETVPRLIELCFQTAGAYELGTEGRMGLPTHLDRVTRFAGADRPGRLTAVVTQAARGMNAEVVDEHGEVRVRLEGYRTAQAPGGVDAAALAPIRKAMS